jgi:hypothetical protein
MPEEAKQPVKRYRFEHHNSCQTLRRPEYRGLTLVQLLVVV